MRASWQALPQWPHPDQPSRPSQFRTTWARSLDGLEAEIERVGGSDVLVGIVAAPDQFTLAGQPKNGFKVLHRGVEVSFDTKDRGRLVFRTAVFPTIHDNIHAIAKGMAALRAVDRYGITSGNEQYEGFKALAAGDLGPDPERGKRLAEESGGIRAALKAHHPDHGGDERDFRDVEAYKRAVGA